MEPIKSFFVEQIPNIHTWWLSVWDRTKTPCPNRTRPEYGHAAQVSLGAFEEGKSPNYPDVGDPRWPTKCDYCQGPMTYLPEGDATMTGNPHYRRVDGGATIVGSLPPGAMYFSMHPTDPKGPDGKSLVVVLPPDGHHWYVDGMASNCTVPCKCGQLYVAHNKGQIPCKKFEPVDDRRHRCWVRHGAPPLVHVDKGGLTCQAGGGSIQTSSWHGFLTQGRLQLNR